jgi:hypothetical protein
MAAGFGQQVSALHPRFEAYGFAAADADLVNSFRYAAKRAGWSAHKTEQAFEWFKSVQSNLGHMTTEQRLASFAEFTAARGWRGADTDVALDWFEIAQGALDRGEPPPLAPAPTAHEDNARRAEIEQLMREDPNAYWRDVGLQDELYEIGARADGSVVASSSEAVPVAPAANASGRRGEIESLMRTSPDAYWRDPGVQAEYRALLGGSGQSGGREGEPAGGAGAMTASPAGNAGVGGE